MTRYKCQNFASTFKNARKGMRLTLKSERNIRVHLLIAALVLITAYCLNFNAIRFCVLVMAIAAVISAEMLNSAIEFSLDAIFHNRYSRMVGMAKDIAAGAVMVVTISAIIVGVLLGLAYALFELPNSFVKRRLGITPGKPATGIKKAIFVFVDQADSIFGCALVVWLFYDLGILKYLGFVVVGAVTHIVFNMLLYFAHLRKNMF